MYYVSIKEKVKSLSENIDKENPREVCSLHKIKLMYLVSYVKPILFTAMVKYGKNFDPQ